jgi:hypothetical protein
MEDFHSECEAQLAQVSTASTDLATQGRTLV